MNKKKIVLFDIDYTLFKTDIFKNSDLKNYEIYEEVFLVLNKLSKIADLGIFSKGDLYFQNTKLIKTGVLKFFKEHDIHIFDNKDINLEKVLEKYKDKKFFLVDDKLPVLYNAKLKMPSVFTIWVKRGPFAESQQPIKNFSPDAIIKNLSDLDKII